MRLGVRSTMQQRFKLLGLLADGRFHSGQEMGIALGIGRGAVWKHLKALSVLDIDIHAVPGRGYQLAQPVELLSEESILGLIDENSKNQIAGLEIFHEINSTNSYLMRKASLGCPSGHICLAESQQEGRGRHGQRWVSPYARNIYLSILWDFSMGPDSLVGLGLALGVGVMRALHEFGISHAGLKWPNDVIWNGAKLAGILLEMTGTSSSNCRVVAGVGLNVDMPAGSSALIDRPWTDVNTILGRKISRNSICACLIHHLLGVLTQFEKNGLSPFLKEWRKYDVVAGKKVTLLLPGSEVSGVSHGIDDNGALLIEGNNNMRRFYSGEISRVDVTC